MRSVSDNGGAMRVSVRKRMWVLGIVTLACSSEITAPDNIITTSNVNTPASVVITPPASSDLFVGQSISLVAAVKNASGVDILTVPVIWSTSDVSIATVTPAGVLTGIKVGTVTITGTAGDKSASVTINVKLVPVRSVTVTLKASLLVGETSAAAAVSVDAQGNALVGRTIAWGSRNSAVATVSNTGLVTGVSVGTTTIDAVVDGVIGSATVAVAPVPILIGAITVSLAQPTASVRGQTTSAIAVVTSTTGNVLTDRIIQWTSSNTDVATVSQLGIVTAVATGTAVIAASSEGKSGSAIFTVAIVTTLPVASVAVSTVTTTLSLGRTTQSTVVVRDGNGSVLTNRVVVWSSSNGSVATVDASGLVQSTGLGTVTITATSEGRTGSVIITVIPPPVTSVVVSAPSTTLQPTVTTQAAAVLRDVDGNVLSGRIIVWTSSAPATATVSASGLVSAVASGATTITATSEGVSSSITITVPAVATVTVTAPSTNLQPTQTTQGTAALVDAGSNPTLNRVVTWATSAPAVATVSASGLVTAVASGSTSITATSEGVVGSITITVPAVASVVVTASANFVLTAQTSQLTATPKDASNNTLTNRVVTWSSGTPAVATVSASGFVTAITTGTSTISATSEGRVGTLLFTVVPPIGSIAVTSSANALLLNQTSQLSALILDTFGNPVTTIPPVWASNNPTKASVTQAGLVTAIGGGSGAIVTFSASAGGVTSTTNVTVTGHPVEVLAALPQVFLDTQMPVAPDPAGGVIISVANGGNLQTALNTANPGDVIEIANGASFTGNFILPNKNTASTKWIVVRPASQVGMPGEGARMTPAIAATVNLPKILSPNNQGAIATALGAHHYRFVGIEFSVSPAATFSSGLVRFGGVGTDGQNTLASIPSNLILDRVYVHATAAFPLRRCVALNSASSAVIDSYITDCQDGGQDAQAIAGWNGPGPFKIVNNYLQGTGENILFGGADPDITNLTPSDIEIRRNHFFKPASLKGVWLVKNLFEIKHAQRVLVEGNIFENNWTSGQTGTGVVFKTTNQDGACTWCVTQDVTFRLNLVRNVGGGMSIAAAPDNNFTSVHARRLTIVDNVITNINTGIFDGSGRGFLIDGDVTDLVISHNTVIDPTSGAVIFGTGGSVRSMIRDNVMGGGAFGVKGDATAAGSATVTAFMQGGAFFGNVIQLPSSTGYPAGNFYPTSLSAINFFNLSGADFRLQAASAFRGVGTDFLDPGANIDALTTAIAGVIVP